MDEQCPGSNRELPHEPEPNKAQECPECGRGVTVEAHDTDDGIRYAVAPHEAVLR